MNEDDAYTAGFFDGEGAVLMGMKLSGAFSVRVSISQVRPYVLEWVKARYGGSVARFTRSRDGRSYYRWHLSNRESLLAFVTRILPYSRVKAQELDLLREFLETTTPGKRIGIDQAQVDLRRSIIDRLHQVDGRRKSQ